MHPWTLRISLTRSTVKALQERLQGAYARGDIRLVRRISSLLEQFASHAEAVLALFGRYCHEAGLAVN